jgi:hypothetical protein
MCYVLHVWEGFWVLIRALHGAKNTKGNSRTSQRMEALFSLPPWSPTKKSLPEQFRSLVRTRRKVYKKIMPHATNKNRKRKIGLLKLKETYIGAKRSGKIIRTKCMFNSVGCGASS